MLGLAGLPSLIQFFGFMFMPESPRWLVGKNQVDQAKQVHYEFVCLNKNAACRCFVVWKSQSRLKQF